MDDGMISEMKSRMKDPKRRWEDYKKLSSYDGVEALTVFWKESSIDEGVMFADGKRVLVSDFQKGKIEEYGNETEHDDS